MESSDVTSALPDVYNRAWWRVLTLLEHCLIFTQRTWSTSVVSVVVDVTSEEI